MSMILLTRMLNNPCPKSDQKTPSAQLNANHQDFLKCAPGLILTAGEFGWRGNGYSHSLLFDVTVTDDLNYVLQSDFVDDNFVGNDVGINQYLLYTVDEKVKVGARVEWWKRNSASQWAATFGVNVKPMDNLVIRPEIRQDWQLAGPNRSETTLGVDAIISF